MTRLLGGLRTTFAALAVRNFRLFFTGQIISVAGSWMQMIAQAWLVLELTGSGAMLGLVVALQWVPVLVFGPWAGVIADRSKKRSLLLVTHSTATLLALTLGLLVATDAIQFWMVLVLAGLLGISSAFEQPARQTIVHELVGPGKLTNAVSLNTLTINIGRLFGPAVAGLVISTWDLSICFFMNSLSYLPAIATLVLIRSSELFSSPPVKRAKGQLLEGFRYARSNPRILVPLMLMLIVGIFLYEFQVTMPLLVSKTYGGDAAAYGLLQSILSIGAIAGGLWVARRTIPSHRLLAGTAVTLGLVVIVLAAMPRFGAALFVVPFLGAGSVIFTTLTNSSLLLSASPDMRSRVMALFTMAWMGTNPIGGPLMGWIAEVWSPPGALALGGVAAIVGGLWAWRSLRHEPDPGTARVDRHETTGPEPATTSDLRPTAA